MESDSRPTSLRLTEKRIWNLERIACGLGYVRAGKGSIGMLMNAIADGVVELGSAQSRMSELTKAVEKHDAGQLSWVEPKGPVYEEVPCVPLSPYITARDDGSFVDTEEFDKPVPQRRPVIEVSAPVPAMQVPSVPSNASKADKLDLLSKLGFKTGMSQ